MISINFGLKILIDYLFTHVKANSLIIKLQKMDKISEEPQESVNQENTPLIIKFTPNEADIMQSVGTICSICQNGFSIGVNINKVRIIIIKLDSL